jgi:hypothetical protein
VVRWVADPRTPAVFEDWFIPLFVRELAPPRVTYNYNGHALLLLDDCTGHQVILFTQACEEHTVRVYFFPPCNSNQFKKAGQKFIRSHETVLEVRQSFGYRQYLDEPYYSRGGLVSRCPASWSILCTQS